MLIWTYHEHTAEARLKLFIYYAYWSYLLLVLSTVVDLILVIYCEAYLRPTEERKILLRSESEETTTPWYMKLWWTVMNLAYPSTFISTILFWAFIHPHRPAGSVDGWVVIVHLEGCLYIVVNMVFSRIPVRIYHTWQIVSLNVVYGFFTCFYYIAGGTNEYGQREIYYFIQWKNRKEMMLNASLALFVSALKLASYIMLACKDYECMDLVSGMCRLWRCHCDKYHQQNPRLPTEKDKRHVRMQETISIYLSIYLHRRYTIFT
ncbi:unnamed protein product [Acanthosepion pharaonis]|nr:unnamed protein product [Sepia pharaonis]